MSSRQRSSRRSASSASQESNDNDSDVSENDSEAENVKDSEEKPASTEMTPQTGQRKTSSLRAGAAPTSAGKSKSRVESGTSIDSKENSSAKVKSEATSNDDEEEGIDVVIPSSLLSVGTASRECTVLIQIDPQDASTLDFHGASGAVGRFEADDEGIKLDLKGFQYTGTINPGPTVMVASMTKGGQLKVESLTDEFVTLRKTQDVMAQLDAVVEGDMDRGYRVTEEDVNRGGGNSSGDDEDAEGSTKKNGKGGKTGKKKTRTAKKSTGGPAAKKRRTSSGKGKKR